MCHLQLRVKRVYMHSRHTRLSVLTKQENGVTGGWSLQENAESVLHVISWCLHKPMGINMGG